MTTKHWHSRPLRITQTVLRQLDAVGYDAAAVVDYLRTTHSNCLVVNGGGIFDFFPSPLPFANPIPQLNGRDILMEISTACHEAGIRVIARVDFRGVEKQHWEKHPDWFAKGPDGAPFVRSDSLPLYAPCYESTYRNEHAMAFIGHLFETYPIDGVWHNALLCRGVCHCERCKALYASEVGSEIPQIGVASDQEMDLYWAFKSRSADRNLARLKDKVKSYGEDKAYVAEVFSMFNVGTPKETGIDLYQIRGIFDFLVVVAFLTENSGRPEYRPLMYSGTITRFLKGLDSTSPAVVLWGNNGTSHRYIMDPPIDTRVWLWEAVSLGAGFWNCVFNGHHPGDTHDRRTAYIGVDAYKFIEENEDIIDGQMPVEDVTILYSKPSKDRFGADESADDAYCTAVQGLETVLLENHISYGFLLDMDLTAEVLREKKVLLLPNAAILSSGQCDTLRDWVRAGGLLLATFETSLYDDKGIRRQDFGLADVLGCTTTGELVRTDKDCYQYIEQPDHRILDGIRDTEMLMNGGQTVLTRTTTADTICRYAPIIKNQPPERAWREQIPGEEATITVNTFGMGRAIYFANQTDRLCFVKGHSDYRLTMANAIRFLMGDSAVMTTNAPASVHVALTRNETQPGTYVLSLVNHTSGPMRPLRELIPVADIEVELPMGEATETKTLRAEGVVNVECQGGKTVIKVSELREFCSIWIHFPLRRGAG